MPVLAELVHAARKGLEFDPATGKPVLWAAPAPMPVTWYQHAVAYVDLKWPYLAAHSRASTAEALATLSPELTRPTARRPPIRALRAAVYGHAFNPQQRDGGLGPAEAKALAWLERAPLPVQQLQSPQVIRRALDALAVRLDGRPAAANTIARKRAVFRNAPAYAVELGLLPVNPLSQVAWRPPATVGALNPQTVANPTEVRAILASVT